MIVRAVAVLGILVVATLVVASVSSGSLPTSSSSEPPAEETPRDYTVLARRRSDDRQGAFGTVTRDYIVTIWYAGAEREVTVRDRDCFDTPIGSLLPRACR